MVIKNLSTVLISLLLSFSVFGLEAQFKVLSGKYDSHCPTWNLDRFSEVDEWITVGVLKAEDYGYNHAVPISRKGVDVIWCSVQQDRGQNNESCQGILKFSDERPFAMYAGQPAVGNSLVSFVDLEDQYNKYQAYVLKALREDKIKRPSVGSMLELLTRYYFQVLTNIYPSDRYIITGGVSYNYLKQPTLGELDIIIYDKESCKVEVIGEAKASSPDYQAKSLAKAHKQLARFQSFVNNQ